MDTLPELTQALIAHTIALEEETKRNLGKSDELKVSIDSLIKSIEEKGDVADRMTLALKWLIAAFIILIVAGTVEQIIWLYPAMKNEEIKIREVATGKVFEVVK